MKPLVSVVTPTKNRLTLLRETMDSVQAQTFDAWEHIIVDDGSNDSTAEEVLRRAAADPRVRYLPRTGKHAGANVCRNQGLAAACADFVVFLDSDDLLMPRCLARRLEIIQRNADLDFAVFQTKVFIATPGDTEQAFDQDMLGDDLLRFLLFETPWIITGPIWRKAVLQRLGGFDESLPKRQDIDLHVRAISSGCRYWRFAEPDHHVRWQYDCAKVSQQPFSRKDSAALVGFSEKLERMIVAGPGINWARQRALCSQYFILAETAVEAGSPFDGFEIWKKIRSRPLGSKLLYLTGKLLLGAQAIGPTRRLAQRAAHKWKGWMRLRSNPELPLARNEADRTL